MASQKGLGKGLGALLGDFDEGSQEENGLKKLPLHKIEPNPDQPRRDFDPEELEELAESIRTHGVIQPLTVREMPNGYYQIIAGERRWRASRLAGLEEIPAVIIEADDKKAMELALIENLQRSDLNPVEEANGYDSLIREYGLTQEEAAARVGKSRPAVANALRLLSLCEGVLDKVRSGELTAGHARAILQLKSEKKQLEAAQKNLDNCSAVAPISGQVIGLSVTPGQELQANSTLVTISDTSTVTVSATVDERNISYIKTGMSVNLDQWGTSAFGTVETVSLSSTVNNGVASYPITISADNTDGTLQVNSYVNYQIQASQNDNCLMVPIQAVRTVGLEDGSSATVVYVQADSRPDNALELPYQDEEIPSGFYPVQVEIGIQDTYNVEIKSGVNDGDTVFTQMITDQAWG